MARSTQYIGLNTYAKNLVKNAYKTEVLPELTIGMCEEPIPGKVFYVAPLSGEDVNVYHKYTEVVQCEPWSSGPMIFTHLRWEIMKQSGQLVDMVLVCSWIVDPMLDRHLYGEYDEDSARFYV